MKIHMCISLYGNNPIFNFYDILIPTEILQGDAYLPDLPYIDFALQSYYIAYRQKLTTCN